MPKSNVSFVAFGQDHSDAPAFQGVRERLTEMHTELRREGKNLVLGIEHADSNVRELGGIRELHNEGLVQAYCDDMRRRGAEPTYHDFKAKHGDQVQWGSDSMPLKSPEDLIPRERKYFEARREFSLETFFQKRLAGSESDVNAGRGVAKMEEAQLLMWARENGVQVKGLDPVSDFEKLRRLTAHGKETKIKMGEFDVSIATGGEKIDGRALQDMEYERVQGMGQRTAGLMKELSDEGGGCLVAVNMGSAHLGSLEVALRDELQKIEGLQEAPVQMCVLVPSDRMKMGESPEKISDDMMRLSLQDMNGAHGRLQGKVQLCESTVREREEKLEGLNDLLQRVKSLPGSDQDLRELMEKHPGKVARMLNYGQTNDEFEIDEDMIRDLSQEMSDSKYTGGVREKLIEELGLTPNALENAQAKLNAARQELETARVNLQNHKDTVMVFAERVEQRLDHKPGEVFKTASPGETGKYDLSGVGQMERRTVRELLGKGVSSSSDSLKKEVVEDDTTKVSTRTKVMVGSSGSTTVTNTMGGPK